MASNIDPTKPIQGIPTTASVRANFAAAKSEIEALQVIANAALPLAGGTILGNLTFSLSGTPWAKFVAATKRLGVGTDSPGATFHVENNEAQSAFFTSTLDSTASGPILTLRRTRSSAQAPADGLGVFRFQGLDTAGTPNTITYAEISTDTVAVGEGVAMGQLLLRVAVNSVLTRGVMINAPIGGETVNVVIGPSGALAQAAVDGFLYLPTIAGAPSGMPTAYSGKVPAFVDSTNKRIYVYSGSWLSAALA